MRDRRMLYELQLERWLCKAGDQRRRIAAGFRLHCDDTADVK